MDAFTYAEGAAASAGGLRTMLDALVRLTDEIPMTMLRAEKDAASEDANAAAHANTTLQNGKAQMTLLAKYASKLLNATSDYGEMPDIAVLYTSLNGRCTTDSTANMAYDATTRIRQVVQKSNLGKQNAGREMFRCGEEVPVEYGPVSIGFNGHAMALTTVETMALERALTGAGCHDDMSAEADAEADAEAKAKADAKAAARPMLDADDAIKVSNAFKRLITGFGHNDKVVIGTIGIRGTGVLKVYPEFADSIRQRLLATTPKMTCTYVIEIVGNGERHIIDGLSTLTKDQRDELIAFVLAFRNDNETEVEDGHETEVEDGRETEVDEIPEPKRWRRILEESDSETESDSEMDTE